MAIDVSYRILPAVYVCCYIGVIATAAHNNFASCIDVNQVEIDGRMMPLFSV